MSSMPWVKMYTEMLDDTKLGRLNNALRWRFVSLVLLAGECDAEGYLVNGKGPMSSDDLAWRLRTRPGVIARELATLENVGLIANTDGGWKVIKFSERQGRSQSEKRQMWRERASKHRKNERTLNADGTTSERDPAWELAETPEETQIVTRDSRVSHAPRVEKRRVEKNTSGATAPGVDPVKDLLTVFQEAAGIEMPEPKSEKVRKANGSQWWYPLQEMVKTANGSAPEVLRKTVKHLRASGLTIADPNSCLKTFRSIYGETVTGPVAAPEFKAKKVYE